MLLKCIFFSCKFILFNMKWHISALLLFLGVLRKTFLSDLLYILLSQVYKILGYVEQTVKAINFYFFDKAFHSMRQNIVKKTFTFEQILVLTTFLAVYQHSLPF